MHRYSNSPPARRPTGLGSGIDKDRPDYTVSAAADGVVPSSLILMDVRDRPMRRSDRLGQGIVSEELNAWKAWAKAKLEEVPYLRLARLLRCPTGADFL